MNVKLKGRATRTSAQVPTLRLGREIGSEAIIIPVPTIVAAKAIGRTKRKSAIIAPAGGGGTSRSGIGGGGRGGIAG